MPIYTRKGDKGFTYLFNGKRVSKANARVEAYGTIDELNSAIGVAIAEISNLKSQISNVKKELEQIQKDLMEIGSSLANPTMNHKLSTTNYLQKRVKEFEGFIDEITGKMLRLENFILPGGGKAGSMLHLTRTICRSAERKIVGLSQKDPSASSGQEKINRTIIVYLNRLSDLLFTMARFINYKEKYREIIWLKK